MKLPGDFTTSARLLQLAATVFVFLSAAVFAFEYLWPGPLGDYACPATGCLSALVIVSCVLYGKLADDADTRWLIVFILFSFLSCTYSFGFSSLMFRSVWFDFLMVWFALYFLFRTVPDPERLLDRFTFWFSVFLGLMIAAVLRHACRSLLTRLPGFDNTRGCFLNGRLCGLMNANYIGLACACLCMASVSGFLNSKKKSVRFLYALLGILGWLCLGLTGFRTGFIGVSVSAGIFMFAVLKNRLEKPDAPSVFRSSPAGLAAAFFASLLLTGILIRSFALPMPVFRYVMSIWGKAENNEYLLRNLSALAARKITDDDGTFSGRTLIWIKCVKDSLRTPRRFLLGISPLSRDVIGGVYDERHENVILHAHNVYLEILRRFGATGLFFWLVILYDWCGRGIRTWLNPEACPAVRYYAAAAAGILIMGIAEPVPFTHMTPCHAGILFFVICGYIVGKRRDSK